MNVIYAYPWDVLGDPAAPARLAALGVDAVALAASYHSVRAATPFHPTHRLVDARAACYVPVRPSAWTGRLVPATPSWTSPDAFVRARDLLRAEGLAVHAWVVLTHSSPLGTADPDLTVRNAFGDIYPYALCPSHSDVADYCRTLVREIVELGAPDAVILEACGPMGFRHGGTHEKTDGADWSQVQADLLSLCFCAACAGRYPWGLAPLVRAGVDGSPDSVEDALGDLAPAVREVRTGLAEELQRLVVPEAGALPVTLHASPDPWATGPFAWTGPKSPVRTLVGNCWGDVESSAEKLARLRALASPGTRIGAYVLALPPRPADPVRMREEMDRYSSAGAEEFHIYHGGLASAGRLRTITDALAARR